MERARGPEAEPDEPRWLRLAADLRAEPSPATMARVRARLAAHPRRARVGALARPAGGARHVRGTLVTCAWAGDAWLTASATVRPEDANLVSSLLGEDGSFGPGVRPRPSPRALRAPTAKGDEMTRAAVILAAGSALCIGISIGFAVGLLFAHHHWSSDPACAMRGFRAVVAGPPGEPSARASIRT